MLSTVAVAFVSSLAPSTAHAADPYLGSLGVSFGDYKLPAQIYPDVRPDMETELWGAVWHPTNMSAGAYPLVVMLHGNHHTCGNLDFPRQDLDSSYTETGVCSDVDFPVQVPSHLGYAYLAERLASFGFIVVSINTNRGINVAPGLLDDGALILVRGAMILKHLQQWQTWATAGGVPGTVSANPNAFVGKIDFTKVALFGHSRGGEGVRAAQALYLFPWSPWPAKVPGLEIDAMFEVAPHDHPDEFNFEPIDIPWQMVTGTCDDDMSWVPGAGVFARIFANSNESPASPKGLWWVHGANHNFFNTEWQQTDLDSKWCNADKSDTPPIYTDNAGGSLTQQYTLVTSVIPFMRQHLGPAGAFIHHKGFANPLHELDPTLTEDVRVDREYVDSPSDTVVTVLENFTQMDQTGLYAPFVTENVQFVEEAIYEHDTEEPRGRVTWQSGAATKALALQFAAAGNGMDLTGFDTLDFRVARTTSALNTASTTSFSVQLLGPGAQASNLIDIADAVDLVGPFWQTVTHTVRIRLTDFDLPLDKVRGVRFVFDQSPSGEVWLDDVLFSDRGYSIVGYYPFPGDLIAPALPYYPKPPPPIYTGQLRNIGRTTAYYTSGKSTIVHELEVTSAAVIDDTAEEPLLTIGQARFNVGRACRTSSYPGCRVFRIPATTYAQLPAGAQMFVSYRSATKPSWQLGSFKP